MTSWFSKLKSSLSSTSNKIVAGLEHVFLKKHLEPIDLENIEEALITADLGIKTTEQIVEIIKKAKFDKNYDQQQIKVELIEIIKHTLAIGEQPFQLTPSKPEVILVCGVNGNGKTTTIGKLAFYLANKLGLKVMAAACDTFRAAATEQLESWTKKANCLLFKGEDQADPASVAYKALTIAQEQQMDVLLIDTAGRLQNYTNLMGELTKIGNVLKKQDPSAPHQVLLVLDSTTGQNAINQVEQFKKVANVTGLILTKLDGTAKAGIIINIIDKFKLPVYFIGVGEGVEDLQPFKAEEFAKALIG